MKNGYWLVALLLCCFRPAFLSGQETAPWYVPAICSVNEMAVRAGNGDNGLKAKTHSDLSATWKTGPVETFVEYDLVNRQFCGGRVTWHALDWLDLYGGILKNPYILELSISPRNLEAVGYSQSASYLGGYGSDLSGISSRGRDVGLMADIRLFFKEHYNILRIQGGIFNGNGFSFVDNDRFKDVSCRIDLHPCREMMLSVGAMTGNYTIGDGRGIAYESAETGVSNARRTRISGAFWWDGRDTFLRAENTWGKTDGLKTNNMCVLAGCWLGEHLSPSSRYEWFTRDLSRKETATHTWALCLTYKFNADINARVQLNRRHFADGSPAKNWVAIGVNVRLAYKP